MLLSMICLKVSHLRLCQKFSGKSFCIFPNLTLTHILFSASEGPGLLCGTRGSLKWALYFHVLLLPLVETFPPYLWPLACLVYLKYVSWPNGHLISLSHIFSKCHCVIKATSSHNPRGQGLRGFARVLKGQTCDSLQVTQVSHKKHKLWLWVRLWAGVQGFSETCPSEHFYSSMNFVSCACENWL